MARIKRGEHSQEVLERLSDALKPKLKIGRRIAWDDDERHDRPEKPTDLMAVDYEIEEGLTEEEVLSFWPENAPADVDARLLTMLTGALAGRLPML